MSCDACGSTSPRHVLGFKADHDHQTGLARGSLCHPCNTILGFMEKYSLEMNPALAAYLARYSNAPVAEA